MSIKYIKDEDFKNLTKKQKIELPEERDIVETEINKLVIIPTNKKNDGYKIGHFFAYTEGNGWWKPSIYDCWEIITDIKNPAKLRYTILRGDFENDGINIFEFIDEYHKAFISYGGKLIIRKNV
jgi:flavodoxin